GEELLPFQLLARTNQPDMSCAAFWNEAAGSFSFGRSSAECVNIAEVPGILLHEVGHMADSLLGGTASDGASGEAQADLFAYLQLGDMCIGRGLRPGIPCHGCDALCTGVRDLERFTAGGASPLARPGTLEAADGLACDRLGCPYPGGGTFRGPLGFQAHCESQIASSAILDLAARLSALRGEPAGRQALEDLWFTSLPALGEAYRLISPDQLCSAADEAVDGCGASNWYTVLLAADDDDGDLSNGTPNGCLIWQAFNDHGIACGASPACFCRGGGSVADAGPDVTICRGEEAVLGAYGGDARSFRWQPGDQRTPQILVSPDQTTEYTLTVQSSCGETHDTVVATVVDCAGFQEDFESDGHGWTTSGLWHRVDATPCVAPPAASGSGAMYYGSEAACGVETGRRGLGDLVSPPIAVGEGQQVLSFDYFLGPAPKTTLGQVEVAVRVADGEWVPRWAMKLRDLEAAGWQASPSIFLGFENAPPDASFQLRFRFETFSLAAQSELYRGWLIDNVQVQPGLPPETSGGPTVSLVEAPAGPLSKCECVRCWFQAEDSEGRDLSDLLTWSSDLDGAVGTGSPSALILSPGDHVLTGTVVDYAGRSAALSIALGIIDDSVDCGLDSWPPAEPELYCGDDDDA
ncbi:MAG: hypothetical protein AAF560_06250, partial [Acidobacteriota bacterium]